MTAAATGWMQSIAGEAFNEMNENTETYVTNVAGADSPDDIVVYTGEYTSNIGFVQGMYNAANQIGSSEKEILSSVGR